MGPDPRFTATEKLKHNREFFTATHSAHTKALKNAHELDFSLLEGLAKEYIDRVSVSKNMNESRLNACREDADTISKNRRCVSNMKYKCNQITMANDHMEAEHRRLMKILERAEQDMQPTEDELRFIDRELSREAQFNEVSKDLTTMNDRMKKYYRKFMSRNKEPWQAYLLSIWEQIKKSRDELRQKKMKQLGREEEL